MLLRGSHGEVLIAEVKNGFLPLSSEATASGYYSAARTKRRFSVKLLARALFVKAFIFDIQNIILCGVLFVNI